MLYQQYKDHGKYTVYKLKTFNSFRELVKRKKSRVSLNKYQVKICYVSQMFLAVFKESQLLQQQQLTTLRISSQNYSDAQETTLSASTTLYAKFRA